MSHQRLYEEAEMILRPEQEYSDNDDNNVEEEYEDYRKRRQEMIDNIIRDLLHYISEHDLDLDLEMLTSIKSLKNLNDLLEERLML